MDLGMVLLVIVITGVLWLIDQGDQARKNMEQREREYQHKLDLKAARLHKVEAELAVREKFDHWPGA